MAELSHVLEVSGVCDALASLEPRHRDALVVLALEDGERKWMRGARAGDRLVIYSRTPVIARIAAALPPYGVDVPRAALGRMNELLATIGGAVGVETSHGLACAPAEADPRLHIQLFRMTAGMCASRKLRERLAELLGEVRCHFVERITAIPYLRPP